MMKRWWTNYVRTFREALHSSALHNSPQSEHELKQAKIHFERRWNDKHHEHTARLADFELIRVLGRGKFGNVVFARYRKLHAEDTKAYVAIKIMLKRKVATLRGPQNAHNERKLLACIHHPFVIGYRHHFKDNANLYLVLEYMPGGDFYSRLKRTRVFEPEHVLFYASQIVLVFEYLHYLGVVYRDLKPENLLLDHFGYLKLADLGLCKKIDNGTTKTMCGTPEYLAPEVVSGLDYSFSVDWWTLGILVYELIHGRTPFRSGNMLHLLRSIVKADVLFPDPKMDPSLRQLISKLLTKKRSSRLSDAPSVKKMPYFEGVDWTAIYQKSAPAPFVPPLDNITDTRNFEKQTEINIEESDDELYPELFEDF